MAIRYSGDTEVRFRWDPKRRVYVGTVRDPRLAWRGEVSGFSGLRAFIHPRPFSSENYDRAALKLIEAAEAWARRYRTRFQLDRDERGIRLRRVFQSPCPLD